MSSKPTDFRSWLLRHVYESSHVGHLAADVRDDTTWPEATEESFEVYRRYLVSQGAITEALDALEAAWKRYEATRT